MKLTSLVAFVVLLALGAPVSQAVKSASREKAKQGDCPFFFPTLCLGYQPPQCHSDWECVRKEKCCHTLCGLKCLHPEDSSQPVKVNPGKCPVVTGQCMIPNPINYCLNDGHCLNTLKCCKGMCGNLCVKPV